MNQIKMFKAAEIQLTVDLGPQKYSLGLLMDLYEGGKIQKAPFQRDYCWDKRRRQGWARSLASNKRLKGSIFLYSINPEGINLPPYYVADGWQRLNCTLEILKNPEQFGIEDSIDEFRRRLYSFPIIIDTDSYPNHYEGFIVFKQVNLGLALHPEEFNKGYFITVDDGIHFAERMEEIVNDCDIRISSITSKNKNGGYEKTLKRGCYALYLQFIKRHKSADLWNYSSRTVNGDSITVEELVVEELRSMSRQSINQSLKLFEGYLQTITATIEDRYHRHTGNYAERMNRTLFRSLLHLGIYKRNTNWGNQYYEQGIDLILSNIDPKDGRMRFPQEDGDIDTDSVRLASFSPVLRLLEHFNIPTQRTPRIKRKRKMLPGWDDSHILPYSTNGNGETLPEPSSRNRARGAQPVEPENLPPDFMG